MAEKKQKYCLKISNIPVDIGQSTDLTGILSENFGIALKDFCFLTILRKSIDARRGKVKQIYTVKADILLSPPHADKLLSFRDIEHYVPQPEKSVQRINRMKKRPVIIGCGPAGLFSALTLLERGVKPIIFERGARISTRNIAINNFMANGRLNTESNMYFGEGGAGTFSDGKLTTRIKTPLKNSVLQEFVNAGAPEGILIETRPHLGTDGLSIIIPNMVDNLSTKGADFFFNTAVTDIIIENSRIRAVCTADGRFDTDHVFLATGQNAHDIIRLLHAKRILMSPKGFAAGFRIEHPRDLIDTCQYGRYKDHPELGAAEYYLTYKDKPTGKGVYSFCMCPGGFVVGCSAAKLQLCTNGMSRYDRNNVFSNAAIVVTVMPHDIASDNVLKGLDWSSAIEQRAYRMGGRNFSAPVQAAADFIASRNRRKINRPVSYRPDVQPADLNQCLDANITEPLKRGLLNFNQKIPGFIEEGILYGAETRTSSPIRIQRNKKDYHCTGLYGLIPVGEVSGYAGGIMSCAVDGIKAANAFY